MGGRKRFLMGLAVAGSLAAGCGPAGSYVGPAQVVMDFSSGALFDAPFPSDHRLRGDGTVDLGGFPNPGGVPFAAEVVRLLDRRARGFGASSAVFFQLSAPLDPASLPDLHDTVEPGAAVFLMDVDPASPDYLRRLPVTVDFQADGGPFGTPNLLAVLPLQGVVLRFGTRYAAVVTSRVRDVNGKQLGRTLALQQLLFEGRRPEGMSEAGYSSYQAAYSALAEAGLSASEVLGLAVFTTWDPTAELGALVAAARALPLPQPLVPLAQTDVFDGYCVYQSRLELPVFQQGEPPYTAGGGEIVFAADGVPVLDHHEEARLVVTIPRQPLPPAGWPTAVMIRTGGGGDRPLVDRGTRDASGEALEPGAGPARYFAAAGFAGVSVDGPHGGIRNVTGGDEQFLIFNIANPVAMRDNLRQSALEIALLPAVLAELSVDVADCPGAAGAAAGARFDVDRLALMGHSMGATIAPLTLAAEPRFRAAILSGAGGSWIENVVYKQSPLPVRPLAEVLIHYAGAGRHLHEHDPLLSLLQWAGEPADPPLYARHLISEPAPGEPRRHVLMLQGIVDTYILPPIANALSLSLGLDLAGEPLDEGHPELSEHRPLAPLLPFVGRRRIALPAQGNQAAGTTAVVVQHPEDGIEDGHEVMFQTEPPKRQYRCFLQSLAGGSPVVVAGGSAATPCP